MKKILNIYTKTAAWLASWGADRYLHLLFGLLIAYVVGLLASGAWYSAAALGVLAAVIVGFVKETADGFITGSADLGDLIFTAVGGAVAYGLIGLGVLLS